MTAAKLLALITHNFRLAWAYKLNFVTRYLGMIISVLLFFFLDQLLQRGGAGQVEGGTYFTFLIIGGAFSKFLELSSHAFSANLREEMLQGTIEPLLVTATPVTLALLGPSSWMLLEGVLLVLIQLGVGTAVGADFSQANWGTAVLVLLVSLSSLISYGIFSAAFVIVFKRGDPMNWFINSVAYVFSGVFFPVELLPAWLRIISYALPFTYALRALRGALMRGETIAEVGGDLLVLGGFTAVLLPLSLFALRYAIRHLKQTGELAHY
ncbi:MAG: ABC transporter permease [Anaerolineaceae bacterium]|nr:ABC transporter permease [Anaerolineaceae bacterium]